MEIGNVVIRRCCRAVVIGQTVWYPDVVVGKVECFCCFTLGDRLPQQLSTSVDVLVGFAVSRLDGDISAGPVAGKELRVWEEKRYQLYD